MSLNARLALVSALFTAPIVLLLGLFVQGSVSDIAFSKKEADGARYLSAIWAALQDPAKGEQAFRDARARYDHDLGVKAEADAFESARDTASRFETGTTLITAVADRSNLTLDPDLDSFYAMDAVTVRLPATERFLLAADEAARNSNRDALLLASDRTDVAAEGALASMNAAITHNEAGLTRAALETLARKLTSDTRAFSEALDAMLRTGALDASEKANAETLASTVNESWVATNKELLRLLDVRIHKAEYGLYAALAAVVVCLALAAATMLVFSFGLSDRIRRIVSTMEALIDNNLKVDIPCTTDRNETGRIAEALISFKESLGQRARLQAEAAVIHDEAAARLGALERSHQEASQDLELVVAAVKEGLGALHKGDLTQRVEVFFPINYKTIRMDLNDTSRKLSQMILEITHSASAMHTSADEISEAASSLSQRTEQQAASLEETAAALDQITTAVQNSARSAGDTLNRARAARDEAVRGRDVLKETTDAIGRIEKSSQQIAQIIGVIDEIAFQTNLLALNAGVEAARAGEAGRGFAVVASEVRGLAQRSSDAAKDIKQLITSSGHEVADGVSLVGKTADALERIDTSVGEINDLVASIASSTKEQALGLSEVNNAINEMDRVTQHNAAMVEQSTAASQSLASEAEHLAELVGRFRVDESVAAQNEERVARANRAGGAGLVARAA